MKGFLLLAALLLAAGVATSAGATSLNWDVTSVGDSTIYTYILDSTETGDYITSLHVYAPCKPNIVKAWSASEGWSFDSADDPDTGGADFYWYANDPAVNALADGDTLQVSFTVPLTAEQVDDFIVPTYLGNWGYESSNYAEWGVLVSFPSVPVPGASPAVPEPSGILALGAGITLMKLRQRK